jgi:formylglycine-generating enzyme required for sulfatase activity
LGLPPRRRRPWLAGILVGLLATGVLAVVVLATLAGTGLLPDVRHGDAAAQAVPTADSSPAPPPGQTAARRQDGAGDPGPAPKAVPQRARAPFEEGEAKELQKAWAAYLGRDVEETLDLGGGEKLTVVLIPPGSFRMGANESGTDEKLHPVTLTRPFYLGKYEVTQGQFEAVMGKDRNKSWFSPNGLNAARVKDKQTGLFPVEMLSWDDADEFCAALTKKTGRKVTLPTEAEWEYAARAGTDTPFHFGAALNGDKANCNGTVPYGTLEGGTDLMRTREVGSYAANAWGLYDVHGNAAEWCRDWYGPYADLPATDPERTDKDPSEARVYRGGSWGSGAWACRAAFRSRGAPSVVGLGVGVRVAVRPD